MINFMAGFSTCEFLQIFMCKVFATQTQMTIFAAMNIRLARRM